MIRSSGEQMKVLQMLVRNSKECIFGFFQEKIQSGAILRSSKKCLECARALKEKTKKLILENMCREDEAERIVEVNKPGQISWDPGSENQIED